MGGTGRVLTSSTRPPLPRRAMFSSSCGRHLLLNTGGILDSDPELSLCKAGIAALVRYQRASAKQRRKATTWQFSTR